MPPPKTLTLPLDGLGSFRLRVSRPRRSSSSGNFAAELLDQRAGDGAQDDHEQKKVHLQFAFRV